MGARWVLVLAASLVLATSGCKWIVRASVDGAGVQANGRSDGGVLSADGRFVAFTSEASNLVPGDTNGAVDVFVRDNRTGQTERVSVGASDEQLGHGNLADISEDGRYVAFFGSAFPGCAFWLLVRDRVNGTTECVTPVDYPWAALSATGRFVAYWANVYLVVLDRKTGEREFLSGPGGSYNDWDRASLAISDDGRNVAFGMLEPEFCTPVGTCLPREGDVFVYDRVSGTYERVPLPVDDPGILRRATAPSISGDGRWVSFGVIGFSGLDLAFQSVWVHDRQTGTTEPVNVFPNGGQGINAALESDISDDGRFIAFGGDFGLDPDFPPDSGLYVRDLVDDRTTLVARGASVGKIADDGRYVAFASSRGDLVPDDTNGVADIFVRAYPKPVVRSVNPGMVPRGTSTKIAVTGDGFAPSPNVNVSGTGVSVASVKQVSEHELRVSIIVDPTAMTGTRSVVVTNTGTGPGPAAGDTGACSGCLTIT
jgi:Quinohemoprotein amine dehydrogenase, alpha subunit domain III